MNLVVGLESNLELEKSDKMTIRLPGTPIKIIIKDEIVAKSAAPRGTKVVHWDEYILIVDNCY